MQANRVAAVCFWGLVLPPCLAVEAEGSASEQELPSGLLNFAYANVLGTGAYQVGGRTVYVLNLPLSVSLPWPDTADWTMSLELPVTVGLHDFDWREVGGIEFSEQIGTLGIAPGLEFVIPVRRNWLVNRSCRKQRKRKKINRKEKVPIPKLWKN